MTQGPEEENLQEQGDVQKNDSAIANEESKTENDEMQGETENKTAKKSKKGGKNKKGKKDFDPLKDEIGKFKKIDFEHALTDEEKIAKKAAKKAKKDAKKNKQEGKETPPKPPKPKKEKKEKSAEIAPGTPQTGMPETESEKAMLKLNPERAGENAIEIAMRLSKQIIKGRKKKKGKKVKEETAKKEKIKKKEKKSKSENDITIKKKESTSSKQTKPKTETSKQKVSLSEEKQKVKQEQKKEIKEKKSKSERPVSQVSINLKVEEIEPTSSKKDLKREESKLKQKHSKLKSRSSLHMKGSKSSGILSSDRVTGSPSYAKFLEARRSRVMRREESFNYELSSSSASDDEERVAAVINFDEDSKKDEKKKKGKRKKGGPGREVSLVISSDQQEHLQEVPTESDVAEETDAEREKKKKKKEKKKKEKKSATDEEAEEPRDINEKIRRIQEKIDDLNEVPSEDFIEEEETEQEKSKKKKPLQAKPKKGKKEKKSALTAAQQKLMEEELAAQKVAEEKARLEAQKLAAIKKEKKERSEHLIRQEHLAKSLGFVEELKEYCRIADKEEKETLEWEKYLECRKLPDASKVEIMNTYLHLWEEEIDQTTIDGAAARTQDVLQLLEELDDTLEEARDEEIEIIENWKWIRQKFREQQAKSLDVATYLILRKIETNMNRIDIPTADYHYKDKNFKLSLWLRVQLPVPMHNPRRPSKPRIELNFPDLQLSLLLPNSIEGEGQAIRALYVRYDHLSDLCSSYPRPPIPPDSDIGLLEATKMEFFIKEKYKYDNRIRKPKVIPVAAVEGENIGEETPQPPPPQPTEEEKEKEYGPDDEIPHVPWQKLSPSPSQILQLANETQCYEMKKSLKTTVEEGELNLRRFTILGGLYHLNLVEQPPQPQHFVTLEMTITRLLLPKELKHVPFYAPYAPPPPPEPGVIREPEEIEMELKKQEEELDALIFVTITLPDHVIFLEPPTVVRWDKKRTTWMQNNIHDVKHNEEKGFLTFRTCQFGVFGLATNLYSNFPHQAWEIKPEADGTVSFQITSAILLIEFNVKGKLVALQQLQNSPNNAIQDIIGVYMRLEKLTKVLQNAGVDIFPAFDAFFYIRGTAEKFWPMEKHLYNNMALLSVCYNFAWSRWNLSAGKRKIVLQMREYTPGEAKQKSHQMLLVTPENALYIDCTEVSPVFNEAGIEGMKFFPDLYVLMKFVSTMSIKNKIAAAPKELVNGLTKLLLATRVLSFS